MFAERPAEFYHLLTGMLSELRDGHVSLRVPAENWVEDGVAATSVQDLKGFELVEIDGHYYVVGWPRGLAPTPPDHLPLDPEPYPELVGVEGFPVVGSLAANLMLGPPDRRAELQLRWPDGTLSRHSLPRPPAPPPPAAAASEPPTTAAAGRPPLEQALRLGSLGDAAYLRIDSLEATRFGDGRPDTFVLRFDELLDRAAGAPGLVLDLRYNGGGRMDVAGQMLGRFLTRPVIDVRQAREDSLLAGLVHRTVFTAADVEPREPTFTAPIVVLTTQFTASAAEAVARVLQRDAGALVVGERTRGLEAVIREVRGEDGSTLRFGGTRRVDVRGRGVQDVGVLPDVVVRLTLDDIRQHGVQRAYALWVERLMDAAQRTLARMTR